MDGIKVIKMPNKHFYFSIGALIGTFASFFISKIRHKLQQHSSFFNMLYKLDRHWFLYFPILIFFIGLWGLVPDILHALKILPKEVTRNSFFNIFFLHSYFEQIEDIYPFFNRLLNWVGEIILLGISIGTMIFYVSQIKRTFRSKHPDN